VADIQEVCEKISELSLPGHLRFPFTFKHDGEPTRMTSSQHFFTGLLSRWFVRIGTTIEWSFSIFRNPFCGFVG